jgi:hypothetical protein
VGGDYFSPVIAVTGGQEYCVAAAVKWTSGSEPFVGVELIASGASQGIQWVIGDAAFNTTPVAKTNTGWQSLKGTVALAADITAVRLVDELWAGGAKAGSDLVYFDGLAITSGACTSATVSYLENWESGPDGWADMSSQAPTLATDATSPGGPAVQALSRTGSGGDYFSPAINVTGGQTYCVQAAIRWESGGAPFVGLELINDGASQGVEWLIGDAMFTTTPVSSTNTGWQVLAHTVVLPAGTTQVRLTDELYGGSSKGGSDLAYFDGIGISSGACN